MKLKEIREKNQLSQVEVFTKLNIAKTTYNGYEKERREPDIKTLCQIADFYGVSLDFLCDHKTNQLDISYYSPTAKEIVKKLPQLSENNLKKLDSVCDGLILGQ